jgi:hypothetical protein
VNRRMRNRTSGGVGGRGPRGPLLPDSGVVGVAIETTGHEGKGQEGALEADRERISLVATPS